MTAPLGGGSIRRGADPWKDGRYDRRGALDAPSDIRDRSRIGAYLRWLEAERGLRFGDGEGAYARLWQWSVDDVPAFWRSIWDYFEVVADTPPTAALADARMPGARWFPGARLNYAENVLRMPGVGADDPIVIGYSQSRATGHADRRRPARTGAPCPRRAAAARGRAR